MDFIPQSQITDYKNNSPTHNTDNMGKLFVMVFAFAPASLTDLL